MRHGKFRDQTGYDESDPFLDCEPETSAFRPGAPVCIVGEDAALATYIGPAEEGMHRLRHVETERQVEVEASGFFLVPTTEPGQGDWAFVIGMEGEQARLNGRQGICGARLGEAYVVQFVHGDDVESVKIPVEHLTAVSGMSRTDMFGDRFVTPWEQHRLSLKDASDSEELPSSNPLLALEDAGSDNESCAEEVVEGTLVEVTRPSGVVFGRVLKTGPRTHKVRLFTVPTEVVDTPDESVRVANRTDIHSIAVCAKCGQGDEDESQWDQFLLCGAADCARGGHLKCFGLLAVPEGDWYCCSECTDTASAAQQAAPKDANGIRIGAGVQLCRGEEAGLFGVVVTFDPEVRKWVVAVGGDRGLPDTDEVTERFLASEELRAAVHPGMVVSVDSHSGTAFEWDLEKKAWKVATANGESFFSGDVVAPAVVPGMPVVAGGVQYCAVQWMAQEKKWQVRPAEEDVTPAKKRKAVADVLPRFVLGDSVVVAGAPGVIHGWRAQLHQWEVTLGERNILADDDQVLPPGSVITDAPEAAADAEARATPRAPARRQSAGGPCKMEGGPCKTEPPATPAAAATRADGPPWPQEVLQVMSVKQLRAAAAKCGANVSGCVEKSDMVQAIRENQEKSKQ